MCTEQCVEQCECPPSKPIWEQGQCVTQQLCPDGNSEESSKEGFRKELINNPYKFSYHILVAPSPGITFEDAIKLCGEQQMFLGIIVNEDQNEMVT